MKNKVYKVLSIVIVVLFTLTIIGGIFVLSLNNRSYTASADYQNENINTLAVEVNVWENYSNTRVFVTGTYTFNEEFDIDYDKWGTYNGWLAVGNYSGWFNFPFSVGDYGEFARYFYLSCEPDFFALGYSMWGDFENEGEDWYEIDACVSLGAGWEANGYRTITLNCYVPTSFKMFLDEFAYRVGGNGTYDEGYNLGYDSGYNSGYSDGLNKGQSDQLTNPVQFFITPVHNFLNTNLFGSFSFGMLFNIVLFVAVAVIFIKMFSGG